MKHDFKFFVKEGAGNMFSHGFMSFAAIGVTVACLLIMGTFTLVAYNANENLADLQQENAIVAFVDETLEESEARALQTQIESTENVADCTSSHGRRPGTPTWRSTMTAVCTATWTPRCSAIGL